MPYICILLSDYEKMDANIEQIKRDIEPLRQQIINHPIYGAIHAIHDLRIFMEHHVFAVWDFMSLLKDLQNRLTCTSVPWFPKGDADTRFLINEIVVGEESDIDENGKRTSHYELYLRAMHQCGASTEAIETFTRQLEQTRDLGQAFTLSAVPLAARIFVENTFDVIAQQKAHITAAVFCFGREDLIPSMFHSIVADLAQTAPDTISTFQYYLERHIEVDGGHHSELALQMTSNLCGENVAFWQEAQQAVTRSLLQRKHLWDGAYDAIMKNKSSHHAHADVAQ